MVTYISKWYTSNISCNYKQNLVLRGNNMYTMVGALQYVTASYEVDTFDKEKLEFWSNMYAKIRSLSNFINDKVAEFCSYATKNVIYNSNANWLKDWNSGIKEQKFFEIIQSILINRLDNDRLASLNLFIKRYFEYFDLISSEEETDEKYEELFNTIIQIPSEIFSYLNISKVETRLLFKEDTFITKATTFIRKNYSEIDDNFLNDAA